MKHLRQSLPILFVLAAILLITFIGNQYYKDDSPIRLGAILTLSDFGAEFGRHSQQGIELAVEEINNSGGVLGRELYVNFQDNPGDDPKTAINAFNFLKTQKINLIIGPNWTPSGQALAPLVDDDVILFSPSVGTDSFIKTHENIYSLWPEDTPITTSLAEEVYRQGHRHVSIVGSTQEWESNQAHTFRDVFISLGGTVDVFERPLPENKDLKTEALKVKQAQSDAVILTSHANMPVITQRLRDLGVDTQFYSVHIWKPNIETAQGTFESLIFSALQHPTDEFETKYQNKFNESFDIPAESTYDIVYIFKEAIEKAGTTNVAEVQRALKEIERWNGASGMTTFNTDGSVNRPVSFFQIRDGEIVNLN